MLLFQQHRSRRGMVTKCNALLYAMVIGFGLAAGIHVYVAWSSMLEIVWRFAKGAFGNG